ncbi:unnamed protein product, partial [Rotaria sordida]
GDDLEKVLNTTSTPEQRLRFKIEDRDVFNPFEGESVGVGGCDHT